jgi:hypothetical protein
MFTNPNQFLLDWDIGLVVFGADCHETRGKKYNIVSSKSHMLHDKLL